MSELRDKGLGLLRLGYPIIPIKPGAKYPGLAGWQHIQATEDMVSGWLSNGYAEGGVGILAARFPAIDIDCMDEEIVDKMLAKVRETLGNSGMVLPRVGKPPKVLIPCRTEKPFRKIQSNKYIDFLDYDHKLEVLGDGQQYVIYAVHPDTGEPYRWTDGKGLADVFPEDLPELTEKTALELVDYFERIRHADWELAERSKDRSKDRKDIGVLMISP